MRLSAQKGLSLLELLVVFVIVAMISTVLLQGLGFGLSIYERVVNRAQATSDDLLAFEWFRHVNSSLLPSKDSGLSLVGDSKAFTAVTMSPLIRRVGFPTEFSWKSSEGLLSYVEGDVRLGVLSLSEGATIQYLDHRGIWRNEWPLDEHSHELPAAIRVLERENTLVTAALKTRFYPDLLLEESRRERQ